MITAAQTMRLAIKINEIMDKELLNYFTLILGRVPKTEEIQKHGMKKETENITEYFWKLQPVLRRKVNMEIGEDNKISKCIVLIKRDYLDGGEKELTYTLLPEDSGLLSSSL